ncbi:MAG TPA: hypothetical protein VFC51_08520 [Chloroflexota bacterium]|nr:hypothetical protein [Chloroflexota bacterium]
MDTWEYLEAHVVDDHWLDSSGRRVALHGKASDRPAAVRFIATPVLNELGAQGWELVALAMNDLRECRLVLKRRHREAEDVDATQVLASRHRHRSPGLAR